VLWHHSIHASGIQQMFVDRQTFARGTVDPVLVSTHLLPPLLLLRSLMEKFLPLPTMTSASISPPNSVRNSPDVNGTAPRIAALESL